MSKTIIQSRTKIGRNFLSNCFKVLNKEIPLELILLMGNANVNSCLCNEKCDGVIQTIFKIQFYNLLLIVVYHRK